MAAPLKMEASFFVLTELPMAVCLFCDNELTWPTDIVVVRLSRAREWVDFDQRIAASGGLELGNRVRLLQASYELS